MRDLLVIFHSHRSPMPLSSRPTSATIAVSHPRVYLTTQAPPSVHCAALEAAARMTARAVAQQLSDSRGERAIYVGNALLVRDVDYSIDYTTGQVTTHADSLFPAGRADVRAQSRSARRSASHRRRLRSCRTLRSRGGGQVNFTVFQNEQSSFNCSPRFGRPPASSADSTHCISSRRG